MKKYGLLSRRCVRLCVVLWVVVVDNSCGCGYIIVVVVGCGL